MIDDLSGLTAGGILAFIIIREVLAFLRDRRNGNGNGKGRPLTGPSGRIDWRPLETRLEKMIGSLDGIAEGQAKTLRALDDLSHSGDKSRQALGDMQESIRYLEKSERNRE